MTSKKGKPINQGQNAPSCVKLKPGKVTPSRRFRDLHLHDGRVGRGDLGGPQYRVLREHFAVHLGDKVILAGCVLAPDLSEFDALHCHKFSFSSQSTHPAANPSIAAELLLAVLSSG